MKKQDFVSSFRVITWDSEKDFLCRYRGLMERAIQGDQNAYIQVKNLRSKVFFNTIDLVKQGFYFTEDNTERAIPDDSIGERTRFYETETRVNNLIPRQTETIVEVINKDYLEVVEQLKLQGYNSALLNMASRQNPGGGVIRGAGAQEETIFRRTNLFKFLYQFAPYASQYGLKQSIQQYPLDPNYGGIYSPSVVYFREGEETGYKLKTNPSSFAVISVAAMNRPALTPDGKHIKPFLVEGVKNKIRTIFRICLLNNHDSLVLGALGCGAFCNPPAHVAKLFHEVMEEPEFKNKYSKIIFAIIDGHNARKRHNPEGNYLPFVREFM